MNPTAKVSRIWSARAVDALVLGMVGANLLGALALGQVHGQVGLAATVGGLAALVGALGMLWARGTLVSCLALTSAVVALVALQIHLAGGALVYHFNVFVSLSLLLVYRDWRAIAFSAILFSIHHVAFDRLLQAGFGTYCLAAPDPGQIALHLAFVAIQGLVLGGVARVLQGEARAARELELLVNAMGREGKIRLNLEVIRAETPIGQRLQHVQQRMAAAIRAVHEASQCVDAAAQRVAAGSHELMQRTDATAIGLRDSAMCLDQISVIVQHSTEASSEAKRMSETAAGMANQGGRLVDDVVNTMQDIEASSRRITDIIAVIDGIAFQTNILALNAAVEAARAGEQGRGFAVVAGEVRNLAQRSAAAAKEIKGLIGASASTIHAGTRQVGGAGETMNQLVGSVRRVGELFEAVTADTSEHMQGLRTVSQSMADLGQMTQQNVALAEQAGGAAADLQAQAARLAEVLNSFNVGGATARAAATTGTITADTLADPTPAQTVARATPAAPVASVPSTVDFF